MSNDKDELKKVTLEWSHLERVHHKYELILPSYELDKLENDIKIGGGIGTIFDFPEYFFLPSSVKEWRAINYDEDLKINGAPLIKESDQYDRYKTYKIRSSIMNGTFDMYTNLNFFMMLNNPNEAEIYIDELKKDFSFKKIDPFIVIADSANYDPYDNECSVMVRLKEIIIEAIDYEYDINGEDDFAKNINSFCKYLDSLSKEIKEIFRNKMKKPELLDENNG